MLTKAEEAYVKATNKQTNKKYQSKINTYAHVRSFDERDFLFHSPDYK